MKIVIAQKDGETRAKLKDGRDTWEPPDPRHQCSSVPIAWVGRGVVGKEEDPHTPSKVWECESQAIRC